MTTQCTECHGPASPATGLTYQYIQHGIVQTIDGLEGSCCNYCGAIAWNDTSLTRIRMVTHPRPLAIELD